MPISNITVSKMPISSITFPSSRALYYNQVCVRFLIIRLFIFFEVVIDLPNQNTFASCDDRYGFISVVTR